MPGPGTWTLTIVGQNAESNLGPAFNTLVSNLNEAGHRIVGARISTDAGEKPLDLPALINPNEGA